MDRLNGSGSRIPRVEAPRPVALVERQVSPGVLRAIIAGAVIVAVWLIYSVTHVRSRPGPAGGDQASSAAALRDLASQDGGRPGGSATGGAPSVSALGKQGDTISARARVLNVFRMQKSLAAVTDESVFIHATFTDDVPDWVQPGKRVQLDGRIAEVKTKTNIYLSAGRVTSLN